MKRIFRLRTFFGRTLLLWPLLVVPALMLGGCALSSVKVTYDPTLQVKLESRPGPAAISRESEEALLAKGYCKVGRIEVFAPLGEGNKDTLQARLLEEAGKRGGDIVRMETENLEKKDAACKDGRCLASSGTVWRNDAALCPQRQAEAVSGQGQAAESSPSQPPSVAQTAAPPPSVAQTAAPAVRLLVLKTANIREKASTSSRVVTKVSKGSQLDKIGESRGWYQVALSSGQVGWVARNLVKEIALIAPAPATGNIHEAAMNGDVEKVKALLRDNPNLVDSKDAEGCTPLRIAVAAGHKGLVELLLANKADVNTKDKDGVTPLHAVAVLGHTDLVKLLLTNKAEINAKDNAGFTPLHYSALSGHKDVAELLLANKADVNAKGENDLTPLGVATSKGHKDVTELLRRRGGHE